MMKFCQDRDEKIQTGKTIIILEYINFYIKRQDLFQFSFVNIFLFHLLFTILLQLLNFKFLIFMFVSSIFNIYSFRDRLNSDGLQVNFIQNSN